MSLKEPRQEAEKWRGVVRGGSDAIKKGQCQRVGKQNATAAFCATFPWMPLQVVRPNRKATPKPVAGSVHRRFTSYRAHFKDRSSA